MNWNETDKINEKWNDFVSENYMNEIKWMFFFIIDTIDEGKISLLCFWNKAENLSIQTFSWQQAS